MRLEWIDDLLAVLDSGSLARAAERRFVTQSAFTRRIRMIEDSLGTTLFDRRRKPVTLMPGVAALEPELRELSARLRCLSRDLRLSAGQTDRALGIVCQHALTTTVSSAIVSRLNASAELCARVLTGNQDECLMLILSHEADIAIMYDVPGDDTPFIPRAFEAQSLGQDLLIPVCIPGMQALAISPELPLASYPADAFLGQVFKRKISPQLPEHQIITSRVETAQTLAMLQFVLNGIGIAWLPHSLVCDHLARGQLVRLDELLPAQVLAVKIIRLSSEESRERVDALWQHMIDTLHLPGDLEHFPDAASGLVEAIERAEQ